MTDGIGFEPIITNLEVTNLWPTCGTKTTRTFSSPSSGARTHLLYDSSMYAVGPAKRFDPLLS